MPDEFRCHDSHEVANAKENAKSTSEIEINCLPGKQSKTMDRGISFSLAEVTISHSHE